MKTLSLRSLDGILSRLDDLSTLINDCRNEVSDAGTSAAHFDIDDCTSSSEFKTFCNDVKLKFSQLSELVPVILGHDETIKHTSQCFKTDG